MTDLAAINDTDVPPVTRRRGQMRLKTIDDIDGRTRAARVARELVSDIESDLGGGVNLSAATRALVKRAAMLSAIVEDAEARWLEGRAVDLSIYGTLTDRLRRTLLSLGLERRARDITAEVINQVRRGQI